MAPVWEYLTWSINLMFQGTYPATGFRGRPASCMEKAGLQMFQGRKLRLIELRADWKQHAESFRLVHHFTCRRICHQCQAARDGNIRFTDFNENPAWKPTIRTHREFLLEEIGDPVNMLVYSAKFDYRMIKWDSMHATNLGCGLHANGSVLHELLKVSWFGEGERSVLFRSAYRRFREFLKMHKIPSSQPVFKTWMLVSSGEEYCYFASKAIAVENVL